MVHSLPSSAISPVRCFETADNSGSLRCSELVWKRSLRLAPLHWNPRASAGSWKWSFGCLNSKLWIRDHRELFQAARACKTLEPVSTHPYLSPLMGLHQSASSYLIYRPKSTTVASDLCSAPPSFLSSFLIEKWMGCFLQVSVWANRIFPSNWPDFSLINFKAIFEGLGLRV